jgi:hypothetical protein
MSIVSFAVKENENSKCIRGHAACGISPGCALEGGMKHRNCSHCKDESLHILHLNSFSAWLLYQAVDKKGYASTRFSIQ